MALLSHLTLPLFRGEVLLADDLARQNLPYRYLYWKAIQTGSVPLWSPELYGGFYLHGDGQAGLLHPGRWLLYRWLPLSTAFQLELLLSYPLALIGSYLLFRRWECSRSAALCGGAAFSFAGPNLLRVVQPHALQIVAHLPWLILVIDSILSDPAPRSRRSLVAALALLTASQLLLGYPQFVLLSGVIEATYVLARLPRTRARALLGVVAAKLLGIGMGAAQLVPTWQALRESVRSAPDLEFLGSVSIHPLNLLQWANPYFAAGRKVGPWGLHESSMFFGISVTMAVVWFVLKPTAESRRSWLVRWLSLLLVAGAMLALGRFNVLFPYYANLPILNVIRGQARWSVLAVFAIAGLWALSLDALRERRGSSATQLAAVLLLVLLSVAAPVLAADGPFLDSAAETLRHAPPLLGAATACSAALVLLGPLRGRRTLLVSMAVLETTVYFGSYFWSAPTATPDAVAFVVPPVPPPGPVVGPEDDSTLVLNGYRLLGGMAGLEPAGRLGRSSDEYARLMGARAIWREGRWLVPAQPLEEARLDAVGSPESGEGAAGPHRGAGTATILVEDHGRRSVLTVADRATLCVLARRYHEGWQASRGGVPVPLLRVAGDLTGFLVPAGEARTDFVFEPASLRLGVRISLASALALLLLWGAGITSIRPSRKVMAES